MNTDEVPRRRKRSRFSNNTTSHDSDTTQQQRDSSSVSFSAVSRGNNSLLHRQARSHVSQTHSALHLRSSLGLFSDDIDSDGETRPPAKNSLDNGKKPFLNISTDETDVGEEKAKHLEQSSKIAPEPDDTQQIDPLDCFMQTISAQQLPTKRARGEPRHEDLKDDNSDQSDSSLTRVQVSSKVKKQYGKVDHSKISYLPFEKNLYIEVPELTAMTHAQVASHRRSSGNIRVRGRGCPRPIASWSQCGLSSHILATIQRCNYLAPTPIQAQAIPCIMSGRDVIGIAKTGSGKTLAYLLPLLRHMARRPRAAPGDGPGSIIIAPTRELTMQIYSDAKKFVKPVGLHCVCAYGGSGLKDQIAELKRGADIVVCTPGRMIDLLAMNSGRVCNLRRITFVVLDEADRMFDMGFEPQLTRIVENIRPDRQTVMFSATFPISVEKLARKVLTQPIEITVGGNAIAPHTIKQHVEIRREESKFLRLLELLGTWYDVGSTLVFVDRQDNADRIFGELSKARYRCLSLHGGLDQADRDSAIVDFKNGDIKILVATSVAARGLDVKHLTLVVNYDVPSHYEDYVHRVGRTGRAGKAGTAYTFITPEQDCYAPYLVRAIESSARATVEAEIPEGDKELSKKVGDEAAALAVPPELRALADEFEKKKSAGVVKHTTGSGYGGRGYKFEENDEEFNAAKKAIRKMQAKQYGRDDEIYAEANDDSDDDDEPRRDTTGEVDDKNAANDSDDDIIEVQTVSKGSLKPRGVEAEGRDVEKLIADAVHQAEVVAQADGAIGDKKSLIAKARAQILSQSFGLTPGSPGGSGRGEDGVNRSGRFAGELEINDYPQHARWQVTKKGSLDDVEEFTGCVVTTRGNFYAAGRNPPPGQRKLHLLIEGPTREAVRMARRDIRQKLVESAALSRPSDQKQYAKYSVV